MAKLLKNIVVGSASGASAGVPGVIVGGLFGLGNSIAENRAQKQADKRARQFQDEQAQKQFDRQFYFDNLEKRWNSEQAQLQRIKDAGLNPNLVYGQLSASTVNTPSVPLGSAPNGVTRDFDVASSALQGAQTSIDGTLKAAEVDNLNQNTANQFQDTLGKDIENRYKESGIIQTLTEQLERINKLRADIEKTGADTKTVDALRDNLVEQLNQEIELLKQKQQDSQQGREESKQRIEESKQSVKESKQRVIESGQRIEESNQNIKESQSRVTLNNAVEQMRKIETKDLLLKYHLSNDQYLLINDFVHKHNLPAGSEKVIIQALENFAQSTGKTIPEVTGQVIESWLDGGNWLNYFVGSERNEVQREGNQLNFEAQEHRTDAISQGYQNQTEDETPQRQGNDFKPEFDRAYTPQQKEYIRDSRKYWQYLDQNSRQQYYKMERSRPKMTQLKKAEYVRELYYNQYGTNKLPDDD